MPNFRASSQIDFNDWFTDYLILEANVRTVGCHIIRRRIIWLIGKWSGVRMLRGLRPEVYQLCLYLLRSDEDMAVRIEASNTLMAMLDDFEFEPQQFFPCFDTCFTALLLLLKEAKEWETKTNILNILSTMIDRMSDYISTNLEGLINYLPLVWQTGGDENMLKCAVLSTLHHIVKALCDIPPTLKPFLYSLIEASTNINENNYIYLIEDGLNLWLSVLNNSSDLCEQLLFLSNNLFSIIEYSSENLRFVLKIMEAYLILNPSIYLNQYGYKIVEAVNPLLRDLNPEGVVMILTLYETFIKADSFIALRILKPVLPNIFRELYGDNNCPMVTTVHLGIVARVLISDHSMFHGILTELQIPYASEKMLDIWLSKTPLVVQVEKRKLLALALASILTSNNDTMYNQFPRILKNISECLKDIMREDVDGMFIDALLIYHHDENATVDDADYKTHHSKRLRNFRAKDIVHKVALIEFLQHQINSLHDSMSEECFRSLILALEVDTLRNLKNFLDLYIELPGT